MLCVSSVVLKSLRVYLHEAWAYVDVAVVTLSFQRGAKNLYTQASSTSSEKHQQNLT